MKDRPGVKDLILKHFRLADMNGDKALSGEELTRYFFDMFDTDKDGTIRMPEMAAAYEQIITYTMLSKG